MPLIHIENCEQCLKSKTEKVYTSDSWDNVRKVTCTVDNRVVHSYLDWHEESTAPSDCPLDMSKNNNEASKPVVTVQAIKKLRELTGDGMLDCKKALIEAGGDIDKALLILKDGSGRFGVFVTRR